MLLPLLGCEKKKRSRLPCVRPAKAAVDASMSAQEEHAKAKKNRERRAKAEAEAKAAEAVLAAEPSPPAHRWAPELEQELEPEC